MTAFARVLFAGAALSLAAMPAAQAADCSAAPAFVSVSTANANVRASASRIERSDWSTAEHFARSAINSGTTSRNKAAAAVNLCAALANQGSEGAADACNDAAERTGGSWEAHTNRGAALWLAGDQAGARADFTRAGELAGGETAVQANLALAACTN
jgi:Flp pilus assembly protein TadD